MRIRWQKLFHPVYKRYHFWYHRKPRKYTYKNVYTWVQPGVFSPIHTISTGLFLDFISTLPLQNKKVLELGCGSGIIALQSADMGGIVTASDIHPEALKSLAKVAQAQHLKVRTVLSDMFAHIPGHFDYMFINPPFYPRTPHSMEERAWYCGSDYAFFTQLFQGLATKKLSETRVYLVLSEDCPLSPIQSRALRFSMALQLQHTLSGQGEENHIYLVVPC